MGQLNSSGSAVTDAFRYDAYGLTEGTPLTGSIPSPWRFQGKLLESTSGDPDLYDFVARSYAPDLGAFTQLDSVAGSAVKPVSLDRYLYAAANPETLVDPDGHTMLGMVGAGCGPDGIYCGGLTGARTKAVPRPGAASPCRRCGGGPSAAGSVTPAIPLGYDDSWNMLTPAQRETIDGSPLGVIGGLFHGLLGGAADTVRGLGRSAQCVEDPRCLAQTVAGTGAAAADAWLHPQAAGQKALFAAADAVGSLHDDLTSGDPYRVGHAGFDVGFGVASLLPGLDALRGADAAGTVVAKSGWGLVRPTVADSGLQAIVDQLYRPGATIGNGGTADAIRAGVGHVEKGAERVTNLMRWIDSRRAQPPVISTQLSRWSRT